RELDRGRTARDRVTDEPDDREAPGTEPDLVACKLRRRRAEGGGHLGPDGYQGLSHDFESPCIRDAPTVHELCRNPPPRQLGGDLRAGPVDDDHLVTRFCKVE